MFKSKISFTYCLVFVISDFECKFSSAVSQNSTESRSEGQLGCTALTVLLICSLVWR